MNFPHFFGEMSRGIIFSELQGVSFKLAFLQQQQARFNDEAKWLLYHLERTIERSLKKKQLALHTRDRANRRRTMDEFFQRSMFAFSLRSIVL